MNFIRPLIYSHTNEIEIYESVFAFALVETNAWKWRDCCNEQAVKELNRLEGHQYITSGKTAMNWHHAFRNHNESFIYLRFDSHGKVKLPPLLERNPDFKMSFLQYATSNLNDLSAELLLAYLHKTALPALLEEFREELEFPEYTLFELLQEHRYTNLSVPTIYRWMRLLGFKYETRQRCHYVDGHEKPDTKAYRKKFVRRYFGYDKLMHR
jgi:hypothetical protein